MSEVVAVERAGIRYSTVAIVLHWLIAALLIFEVGLGLRMEELRGSARFAVFQLHKSVGITILILVGLRLLWRMRRRPPPLGAKGWEKALAHGVHLLFYVLLFALPVSGWAIVSTSRVDVPTLLYGALPWPHLPGLGGLAATAKAAWNEAAELVHVNLVNLLYVLFALHVAGALKHHFLDRDGDIARMAPGTRPGSWSDARLWAIGIGVLLAAGLGLWWSPVGQTRNAAAQGVAPSRAAQAVAPTAPTKGRAASAPEAKTDDPALANTVEAAEAEVPAWTIASGSTLRFATTWSGEAIEGSFARFDGDIDFSPDQLDGSRVEIRIGMDSVSSGDAQRDDTLKSADWFSVGSYSTAVFKADRFRRTGANRYVANGTLRLKGITLPISLPFTLTITGDRAVMKGTASVDRTAYKVGEGEYASTSEIPAAVRVDVAVNATRQ